MEPAIKGIIMNLREYDITHPYEAALLSTERITPDTSSVEVRHLVFEVPALNFTYLEGQSIGVLTPGHSQFGEANHLRLYSIASPRRGERGQENTLSLCVRRCFYIDDVSGEQYPGRASNYLCDAKLGDKIRITGPYPAPFQFPTDDTSNLLMVGAGTGIAPFRAFVRHIYDERGGWKGQVRLFYGARTGMELVYHNDFKKDLGLYYDNASFRAFDAVSPRPYLDAEPAFEKAVSAHSEDTWQLLQDPKTYVYLAGLQESAAKFQQAMAGLAGSESAWVQMRGELQAQGRFAELLYEG